MKLNSIIIASASLVLGLAGCSKKFLEEKRDLGGVNEEVFQDSTIAQAYVDYVYGLFQPANNATALTWMLATNGNHFTQTTEEFGGETNWNKVWPSISYSNGHALNYFGVPLPTSIGNNTWTRMKQINIFLDNVDQHGLPQYTRNKLKAQLYFWRAWQYFDLVRLYGGVPLVLHAQDPISGEAESLQIQRSSTSACIDQICADLDSAIAILPGKWASADWGRITRGGAAALKGRVLLTWASPLFNTTDDVARWQRAYDANMAAKTMLETDGFGLFKTGTLADGTAWENMFVNEVNNPEAVIVFGFNTVVSDQIQKWNGWEHAARPKEILGNSGLNPTKQMMDAFPMKDGKMPGQSTTYPYNPKQFYKNRDPRWNKTFAYNGGLWPYKENPRYRLWTYRWFANGTATTPASTTEQRGTNTSGIYLRKATNAQGSNASGNFSTSGTDYIELRFAEVLLNLAECAVGIGNISEGMTLVKSIRERAGIEIGDGQYGLGTISGRDAAFAAVINERKLELAYEGKRFHDLRRWMLFNDEFGTCTRLGVQPLDGTRRTGIFIYVKKGDGTKYTGANNQDPLFKAQHTATNTNIITEREPAIFPAGIANQDQFVDSLYNNHFEIIEKDDIDPTAGNWNFKWYKEYYYFGLNQQALDNSPYLQQTKGWNSLGGPGVFDPVK